MPNIRNRALASAAAVAIVASGAGGATLFEGRQPAFAESQPITVNSSAQAPVSFADVVDKVKPAVVSVKGKVENASASASDDEDGSSPQGQRIPPQLREFFRRYGENGVPQRPRGG